MPAIIEPRDGPSVANARAQACGSEAVTITKATLKYSSIPSSSFGTVTRAVGRRLAACRGRPDESTGASIAGDNCATARCIFSGRNVPMRWAKKAVSHVWSSPQS
jgi:hypothetical protein